MANPAPQPAPSKRPWYLTFALVAAMALGMIRGCMGFGVMADLHADGATVTSACEPQMAAADGTTNADDAASVQTLCEAWHASLSNAKARVFPIAIATLLLGYATALFAARARRGAASSRPLLVQLIVAQGVLSIAAYALLPDTRRAEMDFAVAKFTAERRARTDESEEQRDAMLRMVKSAGRVSPPLLLGLDELVGLLMLLALTRRRARAFFDSVPDPMSPRGPVT